MSDFVYDLETVLFGIKRMMESRHQKYGPGNIAEYGEQGLLVRLGDKYARLKNGLETDFADESVEDTVRDVVGYGLIWLMWRKGLWPGQAPPIRASDEPPF